MSHPARRLLAGLPGVLALTAYLVLAAGPTAPIDATVDTGLDTGTSTHPGAGEHPGR